MMEDELQETLIKLKRSNSELEQFAYVASHDLQEPLRMISSFLQLLQMRYSGQLDSDADEFINFAVEGAKRMQNLIQDLLAYSRVTTKGNEFKDIKMEEALEQALVNLKMSIEENNANITHDPLPIITADYSITTESYRKFY
jgi:light-regulated signal transduction histidine kinase (bacteriophytochrome)